MDARTDPVQPGRLGRAVTSRRALTRAVGHAAWTVPLVQAAISAPAFAGSALAPTLRITLAESWIWQGGWYPAIAVQNLGSVPTTDLTLVVTFSSSFVLLPNGHVPGTHGRMTPGWWYRETLRWNPSDPIVLTFYRTGAQLGPGETLMLGATPPPLATDFALAWATPIPTDPVPVSAAATGFTGDTQLIQNVPA